VVNGGHILTKEKSNLDITRPDVAREISHLGYVEETILDNMKDLASQRKLISEYLVDYRKQMIEENKFDEDKPLDAFDHEMFAKEESYKSVIKRINELEDLLGSPYFGKITFRDIIKGKPGSDEEIYIGKFGFINDKSYDPLIIDWRAPVASLFYNGSVGSASYKTPQGLQEADITNRRQFIIKNSKMLGMFDTDVEVRDEILQYVLSGPSSEKLKDIIMTIQKEQDHIIRLPKDGAVIVNGVAGSGKTTIALHRIAYLLYNFRKQVEDKILILGPNNIFMEYISQVLPSLGEKGVRQNTLNDFIMELLGEEIEVLSQEDFIESIAQGDTELYEDAKLKRSTEYLESIERYYRSLEENLYEAKDIVFLGKTIMTKEEMKHDLSDKTSFLPLIRRGMRVKRTIINRMKTVRNERLQEINRKNKDIEKKVDSGEVLTEDQYISRREAIRQLVEKVIEFRDEIRYLGKGDPVELYRRQNTFRILTHEDLIPMLYLKKKLSGIKLSHPIKYIVIDEAQDYSLNYIAVLKEVTGCKDWTIVGDINQRLIRYDDESFLDSEKILDNTSKFNLLRSYRSTNQIVEHAGTYLEDDFNVESLRQGDEVEILRTSSIEETVEEIINVYSSFMDRDLETIAIITRDFDQAELLNEALKGRLNFKFIKNEDGVYSSNTLLLSAYLSKGLEFDGVILVDSKPETEKPDLIKYIMSTRALHDLTVINQG